MSPLQKVFYKNLVTENGSERRKILKSLFVVDSQIRIMKIYYVLFAIVRYVLYIYGDIPTKLKVRIIDGIVPHTFLYLIAFFWELSKCNILLL